MDWDQYGHCVKCHKNMLIDEVIEGKSQRRLTAEYTEKEFKLNDGSVMRVALCLKCADNIKPEDRNSIMECVIKGWDKETTDLVESSLYPNWTEYRKENYMKEYSKKTIVGDA